MNKFSIILSWFFYGVIALTLLVVVLTALGWGDPESPLNSKIESLFSRFGRLRTRRN